MSLLSSCSRSRAPLARLAASCAAALALFSVNALAGEGGDDKSLYLELEPVVTNLAPSGQGVSLAKAVRVIAPLAVARAPKPAKPADLAALQAQEEATRGVPLPLEPAAKTDEQMAADEAAEDARYDDGAPHYARIRMSLLFPNKEAKEDAKLRMPEIRNRVILMLSSRQASQFRTAQQKEDFANALAIALRAPSVKDEPPRQISAALVTDFIIQ